VPEKYLTCEIDWYDSNNENAHVFVPMRDLAFRNKELSRYYFPNSIASIIGQMVSRQVFQLKTITSPPVPLVPLYISVLFAACLMILTITTISSYRDLQNLKKSINQMEQSWYVNDHLKNINLLTGDVEDSLLGFYITADQAFLAPLKSAKENLASEFLALDKLIDGNRVQQDHLAQLRTLFDRRIEKFEERASHFKRGGLKEVVEIVKRREGMKIMDEVRQLEITMEKDELIQLSTRRNQLYEGFDQTILFATVINSIAALILILFYRLTHQHFSKKKLAEDALKEANENLEATVLARTTKLSILSRHLLKVSEVEKAKLARELHDEMGASLTAIGMDIMMVSEALKNTQPDLANQLIRARQTLQETVELKRRIIEDLRPSMLDNLGLVASIRSHCEKVMHVPDLDYEEEIPEEINDINPEWAIALFRIVQESLNNIIKYAKASHVKISLKRRLSGLWLQVLDDGIGIQADAMDKPKSHGLLGMRERVLLLGGVFTVKRGPANIGTAIEVFLPYPD
jgi:signal transduction histidine kinase